MPKSLVTGGAGFIGSHVAAELLKMGHEVHIIDDLSDGYRENVPEKAKFDCWTILDEKAVDATLEYIKPDYIFHLAGYVAEHMSHYCRRFNYTNNILGSMNLINAAIKYGVKRFVYISSMSVYNIDQMPARETDTPAPADPYGIAKFAVEQDLRAAYERFGLEYTILRPHNVYGERSNLANPYRNVIAIFMRQCLTGQAITIYGDGSQSRQFTYISDVAPIIAHAAGVPLAKNEIINAGSGVSFSINEIAEGVIEALNAPRIFQHLPERKEAHDLQAVHHKQHSIFGEPTYTPLTVGLTRMATWARENKNLTPRPFTTVELPEHVPEALRYG